MAQRHAATTVMAVVDRQQGDRLAVAAEYRDRRNRLGLSQEALADRAGVDRSRIKKVEEGDTSVRDSTIGAIGWALTDLEREMGMDLPSTVRTLGEPAEDMVEFSVEGNFGVRAVVKGPVRDIDALREAVARLIADMNREHGTPGDG
jgi:transcriptional regulator with XRE-family HTH domain